MDITSLISPDCVFCAVPATSKKKLLQVVSELAAQHLSGQVEEHDILDAFLSREKLGSTGIGNGIALPHGRLANCDKGLTFLITTEESIDFDAIDNQPVKIFFALLAPESECQTHLKSLATIAEKLSNKDVVKRIKLASTNNELYQAITE
ncbi:PTS IIA-like nitrogen regulatory protein PtsN [Algibacillus agarilyticus]|uniref:PTS IIA-like nitrogen regulatory protein PtsN n=1 Tax=Algibacillus agarilyticus TaxID=2234133 RepID=UPI000DD03830|nr:PTS IIA-like nitrogen regulatory protein PtsN [Algibacillus agarilyticus]